MPSEYSFLYDPEALSQEGTSNSHYREADDVEEESYDVEIVDSNEESID